MTFHTGDRVGVMAQRFEGIAGEGVALEVSTVVRIGIVQSAWEDVCLVKFTDSSETLWVRNELLHHAPA